MKTGRELKDTVPFQVITPDGVWHSAFSYHYASVYDYDCGGVHPRNELADKLWRQCLSEIFEKYESLLFAELDVHC